MNFFKNISSSSKQLPTAIKESDELTKKLILLYQYKIFELEGKLNERNHYLTVFKNRCLEKGELEVDDCYLAINECISDIDLTIFTGSALLILSQVHNVDPETISKIKAAMEKVEKIYIK